MSREIKLTSEQQQAVDNRGGALLVSAAAGSGKTKVLIDRIMSYIMSEEIPADITDFLIITYTRAAATELRSKILAEITRQISLHPEYKHLRRQLTLCMKANISTIHSFCTEIIRENCQVLDVSSDVRVMDENETAIMKANVLEKVLEKHYLLLSEDCGFHMLCDMMAESKSDKRLCESLMDAHASLQCHPRPDVWIKEQINNFSLSDNIDVSTTPWGKEIISWAKRRAECARDQLLTGLSEMNSAPDMKKAYGDSFQKSVDSICGFISALDKSWDDAVNALPIIFPAGRIKGYDDIKGYRERAKKICEKKISPKFLTNSDELCADMRSVFPAISSFLNLILEFDEEYSKEKRRRSLIDFSDQEHLCLKILFDFENNQPTRIAKSISGRFREILVDEYQDINAVQDLIFSSISKNSENMFMVGDVKQSIYRFRLADPTIFLKKYNSFVKNEEALDGVPRKILLTQNFRSSSGILEAVNYIFRSIMSVQLGEMEYGDDESLRAGRNDSNCTDCCVELDVLDVQNCDPNDTLLPEARFVAERIEEMILSGMTIPTENGEKRIAPGDFCILLRSVKNKAWQYAQALSERGIPSSFTTSENFFETFEISIMISFLSIIDNPLQDVPLVAVLRSPIYNFSSDELAEIRANSRTGNYFSAVKAFEKKSEKCAYFLRTLNNLRTNAPDMSAEDIILHIFDTTSFYALVGAMNNGAKRQANLMRLAEFARTYEQDGYKGLFGFVSFLRSMIENGKEPESADSLSEGTGVRILSIHKSKGLEFPVVFLADTAKKFNLSDASKPMLFHSQLGVGINVREFTKKIQYPTLAREAVALRLISESKSEELRVLYVALTRAKEKLFITASLNNASNHIEKLFSEVSSPILPGILEDKNSFADWLLMTAITRPEATVFGLTPVVSHFSPLGAPWQMNLIYLDDRKNNEVPVKDTLLNDDISRDTFNSSDAYRELFNRLMWRYQYEGADRIPSKLTATELKGRLFDSELYENAEINLPSVKKQSFRRPNFITGMNSLTAAERGTALHAVMQHIDFKYCTDLSSVRREITRLESEGFLTKNQAETADAVKIWRFLSSPLGRRVRNAKTIYREFKISVLMPAKNFVSYHSEDEILFQGAVDCWFEENDTITVIDFKSDFVTEENFSQKIEDYTPQVRSYAAALREITGKDFVENILYFFANGKAVYL